MCPKLLLLCFVTHGIVGIVLSDEMHCDKGHQFEELWEVATDWLRNSVTDIDNAVQMNKIVNPLFCSFVFVPTKEKDSTADSNCRAMHVTALSW